MAGSSDDNLSLSTTHNSEAPLPFPWEQYWDLRTGEEYYINWRNGIRTSLDPRISEEEAEAAGYYPSEDDDNDDDDDDDGDDGNDIWEDDDEDYEYSGDSDVNAENYSIPDSYEYSDTSSDSSLSVVSADDPTIPSIPVMCRTCTMYYLVVQNTAECRSCGSPLIHLPHNGSM